MIKTFKSKKLLNFYIDGVKKGVHPEHSTRLERILDSIENATEIRNMAFPGSGLHKLEPKSENRWSVKVSGNWRLTFIFVDGDAFEVDYTDYH